SVEWGLLWLPEGGELVTESYVNLIPTDQGGTHVSGLRAGLTDVRSALVCRNQVHVAFRSEEHTSELQSRFDVVCRLLLEKNKYTRRICFALIRTAFLFSPRTSSTFPSVFLTSQASDISRLSIRDAIIAVQTFVRSAGITL